MSNTTKYIAVHRIERRIDGKLRITEPGQPIDLTDVERAALPENAVRLPKAPAVAATDEVPVEAKKGRGGRRKKEEATQDDETL